jgi:hypothetical protein
MPNHINNFKMKFSLKTTIKMNKNMKINNIQKKLKIHKIVNKVSKKNKI